MGNVIVDTHGLGGMVGDTPIHVVKTYVMLVAHFLLAMIAVRSSSGLVVPVVVPAAAAVWGMFL